MDKEYLRYLLSLLSDKRPVVRRVYYVVILLVGLVVEAKIDAMLTEPPPNPSCEVNKESIKVLLERYRNGEL